MFCLLACYTLLLLPRSTLTENEKVFSTTKDLVLRKTNFGTLCVSGIYYYKCALHHIFHVKYSFIISASRKSLTRRKRTFLKSSYQVQPYCSIYISLKISLCFPHFFVFCNNLSTVGGGHLPGELIVTALSWLPLSR